MYVRTLAAPRNQKIGVTLHGGGAASLSGAIHTPSPSYSMTNTPPNSVGDSYIALVPRGLHHVFMDRLKREIVGAGYVCNDVHCVGERGPQEEEEYRQHLRGLLLKRKKQHSESIGTVIDASSTSSQQDVSVGYDASGDTVWSYSGTASAIWVCFTTNAPASFCHSQLRFIGPLMACSQVYQDIDLKEGISLEQVTTLMQKLDFDVSKLNTALKLWLAHVQESWSLSESEVNAINDKFKGDNDSSTLTYRLSCFRAQSKKYSFTREQFVRAAADYVVPKDFGWKVDLVNYDVEVVLLIQSRCLAVGIALRPYQKLQAKGFSQGVIPPDVTCPYLSGNVLSGLVRLKPTTAQLLLGMLDLRPGDVLLDPCAGIGTIPLEVPNGVIGLGGDLILSDDTIRPLAVDYSKRMKEHNASCKADLLAWDAALLPLRTSSVDVIVSDLPFGQQCLSSAKLDTLLPLILGELGRALRPGGSMLLLCGAYPSILDALAKLSALQPEEAVWNLPCEAVFPVNIGGLVAWIIKVKRGSGEAIRVPNHMERLQKLMRKRELRQKDVASRKTSKEGHKYRRLQK